MYLKDENIVSEVEKQLKITVNIRRLKYRDTGRPMPVVIVLCNSFEDLQKIFKSEIILGKKAVQIPIKVREIPQLDAIIVRNLVMLQLCVRM